MLRRRLAAERGTTLIELMVAAGILVTGVLGVLTLLNGANAVTSDNKAREGAISLARELIEASRGLDYGDLATSTLTGKLQAQPQLADGSVAAGWQIERRNETYTVVARACVVDDGRADGYGPHTGLPMCSDSTTTGTADGNPDDYRRVSVTVSWQIGTRKGKVRQEAAINNPGSAFATSIRTLTPTAPVLTAPYVVTNPATTSIVFTASAGGAPSYVKWSIDNLDQGNATAVSGSVTNWTFTWNLSGVTDGTYVIGAQAFNSNNESGATQALTIVINRFAPSPPTGFLAGRNGAFGVEMEWNPNAERDVSGYRVYRYGGGGGSPDVKVCETATTDALPTSCRDTTAPGGGGPKYYVVALAPARSGGGVEESVHPGVGLMYTVVEGNVPPNPPLTVSAVRADGVVTLTWTAPAAPQAGETGDTLRYYRIYRDGTGYADRIDRTGTSNTLTWTDRDPGAGLHTYYVTAVDSQLAESTPAPTGGVVG